MRISWTRRKNCVEADIFIPYCIVNLTCIETNICRETLWLKSFFDGVNRPKAAKNSYIWTNRVRSMSRTGNVQNPKITENNIGNVIVRITRDLKNTQQRHNSPVGGIHRGDEIIDCGQKESHDWVTTLLRDWLRQLNPGGWVVWVRSSELEMPAYECVGSSGPKSAARKRLMFLSEHFTHLH